ncbi:ribonucleotide-diphosphate reductase subunit alpha [Streptomyces cyanogenus]|uniref:Ribonucleotide-diphosphate reductase subunit alpha n=1 Tax=Streptomyces cyanogenus TaxID=80860 RepID=A0ABX7TXQ4_STRCY|nr:ribonucleotide-diphosphate reductase subunit alpha [Streptomyces cyanogenus]
MTATNPCVVDSTWVLTGDGARRVKDLVGIPFTAVLDGKPYGTLSNGFVRTGTEDVVKLRTSEGHEVRLTAGHKVLTYIPKTSRYAKDAREEWVAAGDLGPGTLVRLSDNLGASWAGRGTEGQGYVLGNLVGDGTFHTYGGYGAVAFWDTDPGFESVRDYLYEQVVKLGARSDFKGWHRVSQSDQYRLKTTGIRDLAATFGIAQGRKTVTPEVERASSGFYRGFLRGLFDADGHIEGASTAGGVSIRLTSIDLPALQAVQRMLARLGVRSAIRNLKDEQVHDWGERGGEYLSQRSYRLIIAGANASRHMQVVGFLNSAKTRKWEALTSHMRRGFYKKPYTASVECVEPDGREDVYDVTVADVHAFDGNGIVLHTC